MSDGPWKLAAVLLGVATVGFVLLVLVSAASDDGARTPSRASRCAGTETVDECLLRARARCGERGVEEVEVRLGDDRMRASFACSG